MTEVLEGFPAESAGFCDLYDADAVGPVWDGGDAGSDRAMFVGGGAVVGELEAELGL